MDEIGCRSCLSEEKVKEWERTKDEQKRKILEGLDEIEEKKAQRAAEAEAAEEATEEAAEEVKEEEAKEE